MPKSNLLDNIVLNLVLRNTAYTPPAGVYVALYTVAPTAGGGGTEVTGGAYVRQSVTFAAPSSQSVANSADVLFPIATASWGTIVAYAIVDQSVAGNILYFANLSAPRLISINDQIRFPAGSIVCTES